MMMQAPRSLPPLYQLALSFIRATPLSRGAARKIITRYIRKNINYPVITNFRGVPFILHVDSTLGIKALFGQYNLKELAFLKEKTSHPDAVFVDLGANTGFYTQNFLAYGQRRTALAVEPNPALCERIKNNHALLQKKDPDANRLLIVDCLAVGDSDRETYLDLSNGLGNARVLDRPAERSIPVKMNSLLNILKQHGIEKIDVMKVDIEGHEDKALIPFFSQAQPALFPRNIIIEHTSSHSWQSDLFSMLKDKGYITSGKTRGNLLLTRQGG